MKIFPNKRKNSTKTSQEIFKSKNVKKLLEKENRKEELEKLKEIQAQDKTYYYTLFACGCTITFFILLALLGGYQ